MTLEMTTAMWFVFAIVVVELSALAFLWILYLMSERSARREQQQHPAPASPPAG